MVLLKHRMEPGFLADCRLAASTPSAFPPLPLAVAGRLLAALTGESAESAMNRMKPKPSVQLLILTFVSKMFFVEYVCVC